MKWAEDNNVFCRKLQWIGRRNAPDRVFGFNGRTIFVEFKRPGERLRVGQDKEIDRMRAAGMEAYGPVDSFTRFLRIIGGRRRVI